MSTNKKKFRQKSRHVPLWRGFSAIFSRFLTEVFFYYISPCSWHCRLFVQSGHSRKSSKAIALSLNCCTKAAGIDNSFLGTSNKPPLSVKGASSFGSPLSTQYLLFTSECRIFRKLFVDLVFSSRIYTCIRFVYFAVHFVCNLRFPFNHSCVDG